MIKCNQCHSKIEDTKKALILDEYFYCQECINKKGLKLKTSYGPEYKALEQSEIRPDHNKPKILNSLSAVEKIIDRGYEKIIIKQGV